MLRRTRRRSNGVTCCAYSVAELEHDLAGSGTVGRWLWSRFVELPLPEWVRLGGVWALGDSRPCSSPRSATSRHEARRQTGGGWSSDPVA